MADVARGLDEERFITFTLGTFHTAIFVITAVLVVHLAGALAGLLAGLNTLTGLTLFAALWGTTTWSTGRALRGVRLPDVSMSTPIGATVARASRAGALNGILFLGSAALILALSALLAGQGESILVFVFGGIVFVTLGAVAAATTGVILGVLLSALDLLLLWCTRRLLRA